MKLKINNTTKYLTVRIPTKEPEVKPDVSKRTFVLVFRG